MKSIIPFAVAALFAANAVARQNAGLRRMDIEARHHDIAVEKRAPAGILDSLLPGNGNGDNNSSSSAFNPPESSTSGPVFGDGPSENPPSSTTTHSTPPPDTPTSSSTPDVNTQTTPTSTSTSTSSSSSSSSPQNGGTTVARSSIDNYRGTTLYAGTGNLSNLRASQTATSTSDASSPTDTSSSFMQNKTAVAATFTILGIVALGGLVFVGFWFHKKSKRGGLNDEDMWDQASMKEFSNPPLGGAAAGGIRAPDAAVLPDDDDAPFGGLVRKKTVLPSQSAGAAAGALARTRSNGSPQRREIETDEEPDEILQLPPVTNYERPRDSAYDIIPAAPPAAAFASQGGAYSQNVGYSQGGAHSQGYGGGYGNAYASGSRSGSTKPLQPPRKAGDHSSFGSGLGNDPFAGSGFIDATRESTYGPGQAGRGAGYNAGHDANPVGAGNQWPQGYNPYNGYGAGGQTGYSNAYGYAQ